MVEQSHVALIGPGRAGTTLGLALVDARLARRRGRRPRPDAASTNAAAACLATTATLVSDVGTGAATSSSSRRPTARSRPAARRGRAVARAGRARRAPRRLARARRVRRVAASSRPDVRVGALHPLQSFPSTTAGSTGSRGPWAAVAGDPEVADAREELGMRPFTSRTSERTRYHAAAVVAANHLVALARSGRAARGSCGCPSRRSRRSSGVASTTRSALGPPHALTGPVERGDPAHRRSAPAALDPASATPTARSPARRPASPARRDTALDRLLGDLRQTGSPGSRLASLRLLHVETIAELRVAVRRARRRRRASGWCRRWATCTPATCRSCARRGPRPTSSSSPSS